MEGVAVFNRDNAADIVGTVTFTQVYPDEAVLVKIRLRGQPNTIHAIHIHQYGDLRQGCESCGPHWNPFNTKHGHGRNRHAGDLINNLAFDSNGRCDVMYFDELLSLYEPYSIIGRSVMIHDGIDDLGLGGDEESLKTGNAGGRMQCAIIGRAQS